MIFSSIKGIAIPEGAVKQIADSAGRILWKGGAVDVASLAISYSGAHTDQKDVVMSGKTYRLLTLTGSGTLTLPEEVTADVWLCNGGNGGGYGGTGGGGGRLKQSTGITLGKLTVCTVGAGGAGVVANTEAASSGLSSFGSVSPNTNQSGQQSGHGASGGGGGGYGRTRTGDGVTTVPFGETSHFYQHSAGGGGGGCEDRSEEYLGTGGKGGSNGANGSAISGYSSNVNGGVGGTRGGGTGGKGVSSGTACNAAAATYYGSGGGGGGIYFNGSGNLRNPGTGGAGYQGVIYVRIPYEQE